MPGGGLGGSRRRRGRGRGGLLVAPARGQRRTRADGEHRDAARPQHVAARHRLRRCRRSTRCRWCWARLGSTPRHTCSGRSRAGATIARRAGRRDSRARAPSDVPSQEDDGRAVAASRAKLLAGNQSAAGNSWHAHRRGEPPEVPTRQRSGFRRGQASGSAGVRRSGSRSESARSSPATTRNRGPKSPRGRPAGCRPVRPADRPAPNGRTPRRRGCAGSPGRPWRRPRRPRR